MREIIKNIDELTDSREIFESKPHPFVPIFISIIVLLLLSGLIWSFFGEIDNVAKATGVVRPNEKVSTIQAPVFGRVETVNFVEGQVVNKGDVLFTLRLDEVRRELDNREQDLEEAQKELAYLETYRVSIESNQNLFNKELGREKFYFDLVEQYLLNYDALEKDIISSKREISQIGEELNHSKQLIETNLREAERSTKIVQKETEAEKDRLKKQISSIELELENEKKTKSVD